MNSRQPVRVCSATFPVGPGFTPPFAYSADARLLAWWSEGSGTLRLGKLDEPTEHIELGPGDPIMHPVQIRP